MKIKDIIAKSKDYLIKGKDFITHDIWVLSFKELKPGWSYLAKTLKVIILAIHKFKEDNINIQASALTFYSLLSVVPVLAMGFGIAKGFGFENYLRQQIVTNFSEHQEVVDWMINFATSFLEKTKGGLIAGIGIIILLWSVMKIFGNIEDSLNIIWRVKKPRNWGRKFADYLSMMLLAPILVIIQSSSTVFITTQVKAITKSISILGYISPFIFFLIKLIPLILIWLLFTLIFVIMPNTKIKFRSGIFAGIIAGTVFQIVQWVYIKFQIGVANYNAIYGSFAALPLLLVLLQTSWLIVLFGSELSYAHQNIDSYVTRTGKFDISIANRRVLSLLMVKLVVRRFAKGLKAPTLAEISEEMNIPHALANEISAQLSLAGVFSQVVTENPKIIAFQPARDIQNMDVQFVINCLENLGSYTVLPDLPGMNKMEEIQKAFINAVEQLPENKLIRDLD